MAVRIRLRRMGAKKQPSYRLVVADSRSPRDGRFLDTIGIYNPLTDPAEIRVDAEKAVRWLQEGATPTDSARSLLSKVGVWEHFMSGGSPETAEARVIVGGKPAPPVHKAPEPESEPEAPAEEEAPVDEAPEAPAEEAEVPVDEAPEAPAEEAEAPVDEAPEAPAEEAEVPVDEAPEAPAEEAEAPVDEAPEAPAEEAEAPVDEAPEDADEEKA